MWTSKADSRSLRLFVRRVPEDGLHEVAHVAASRPGALANGPEEEGRGGRDHLLSRSRCA